MSLEIVHPRINEYLHQLARLPDRHPVVGEMEAYAAQHHFPIVGPIVGPLLKLLAATSDAKRIFELGSGYGYSAYWFSQGMGPAGKIYCTDGDAKNQQRATDYLTRAGVWGRIAFHTGQAQKIFQQTAGDFDIIYNDVDKDQYPGVFELVWRRVRPGGLYIADNALWSGRVVEKRVTDDVEPGWTEAIKAHSEMIFRHPEFTATIVPLRDGVIVARRRK